ncbi:MAG: hypothetical protein RLY43_2018 [Bacteroidota bacterium]|jgi:cell division ATPase FtsA
MFLGFGKSKYNSDYTLLIFISSNKISFALYHEKNDINEIVYTLESLANNSTSEEILKTIDLGTQKIVSEAIKALSEAGKTLKIKSSVVVLGSNFYESYIKNLVIEKDQSFILTKDQFDKAVEKHAEVINAEKAGKLVLETDVTNVSINGYSLKNPFNKKIKKIDVSFYASFVDEKNIENIKQIIKKNIHVSKIEFKTYTLNKFNLIRNNFLNVPNYISIDVAENYTDVFIVENNSLIYRKYFDFGYQNFINEIADKCAMNPQIVASEIKMSALGELKNTCKPEIEQGLNDQKKKWVSMFVSEIVDKSGINIPSRVFLTTNKKICDIFIQTISDPENKKIIFRNDKELMLINCENKHFSKYVAYKDGVESDIFITINSI